MMVTTNSISSGVSSDNIGDGAVMSLESSEWHRVKCPFAMVRIDEAEHLAFT